MHSGRLYFNLNAAPIVGFLRGPMIGEALHYFCALSAAERVQGHVLFSDVDLPYAVDRIAFPGVIKNLRSARFDISESVESQVISALEMSVAS